MIDDKFRGLQAAAALSHFEADGFTHKSLREVCRQLRIFGYSGSQIVQIRSAKDGRLLGQIRIKDALIGGAEDDPTAWLEKRKEDV